MVFVFFVIITFFFVILFFFIASKTARSFITRVIFSCGFLSFLCPLFTFIFTFFVFNLFPFRLLYGKVDSNFSPINLSPFTLLYSSLSGNSFLHDNKPKSTHLTSLFLWDISIKHSTISLKNILQRVWFLATPR